MREAAGAEVPESLFEELGLSEHRAAAPEWRNRTGVLRFQIGPRSTSHVRHRAKYVDMPVSEPQGFLFSRDGKPGPRARSLKEFVDLLAELPDAELVPYLKRHDFSRWFGQVFRDCPLATHIRRIESRIGLERPRDLINDISQSVRARYEMTPATV
jgi:hypothetical protein